MSAYASGECSRWKHPDVTRILIDNGNAPSAVRWRSSNARIRRRNRVSHAGSTETSLRRRQRRRERGGSRIWRARAISASAERRASVGRRLSSCGYEERRSVAVAGPDRDAARSSRSTAPSHEPESMTARRLASERGDLVASPCRVRAGKAIRPSAGLLRVGRAGIEPATLGLQIPRSGSSSRPLAQPVRAVSRRESSCAIYSSAFATWRSLRPNAANTRRCIWHGTRELRGWRAARISPTLEGSG